MESSNVLLLIDGNSLINRAYYAFGMGGGLTWKGAPTNATYGFLNMFLKAAADTRAVHVAVAFDMRAKTFRHKMYDGYKAQRKGMPDELAVQFADLKELLKIMGVAIIECEGYEADDIIGTLSKNPPVGDRSIILSADRDGLQVVDARTELHLTKTGVTNLEVWDEPKIRSEYRLEPAQLIDLKALMGDKSDNIPGAAGVGEKTALELMQSYGSLENIYKNIGEIKGALAGKLSASEKLVYLSRDLARINTAVPYECLNKDFTFPFPMSKAVYDAFDARGFKSLCKRPNLWAEDYYSSVPVGSGAPGAAGKTESVDAAPAPAVTTVTVKDIAELKALSARLVKADTVVNVWDEESIYLAESVADAAHSGTVTEYRIPKQIDLLSGGFTYEEINECLRPLHESNVKKIVWDSKSLKQRLLAAGIKLNNVVIDIKLADHMINTTISFTTPQEMLAKYKAAGGVAAAFLRIDFMGKMDALGLLPLYRGVELPLVDILVEMQVQGVKIDLAALQRVSAKLQAEIGGLTNQIYAFAGTNFNINSPQQLGDVLYKKLGISVTKKTKTGLSTDESTLQKISKAHAVVPLILRYRKTFKLYSTYIQGFKNLADGSGILHSMFHNTATVTGRLSSSEPNIQNIPARSDDAALIRGLFVSRFPAGKIVACDYSQIELRLLAHFSGDEVMKRAFECGRDIHTETAAKVFGVAAGAVTPDMRRRAKAVNFGIVYGISAYGLSESIGSSVSEAADFIDRYFAGFPRVKAFLDKCRDSAITNGYAVTLLGRRRRLPELVSSNQNTVQFGMRAAMNMPMQGSASDIIKKAMVEISKRLKSSGMRSLMVAQIHDELVFDCPAEEVERLGSMAKEVMESAVSLSVPLVTGVDVKDTF